MGRNVLVVDDDDDARRFIHSQLVEDPRAGLLWEATDALTACALAQMLPVDVVVLDFLLAQSTAADCLPALRQARPDCRIVVYTADVEGASEARVLALGADDLVRRRDLDVDQGVADIAFGTPTTVAEVSVGSSGSARDGL